MTERKRTLGTATVTPTKRRRPGDTSPVGAGATQIRRKYQRMQQQGRGSPLSATALRLLLRKLGSEAASGSEAAKSEAEALHFQHVRDFVKAEYPELRVEKSVEERWIVIST